MNVSKYKNKQLNEYRPPKRQTFQDEEECVASKFFTQILPKLYITDNINDRNMLTKCEITKMEVYNMEKKHARILAKSKDQREDLNSQWLELETKERKFRESFLFFDTFVKENEMKRIRATEKFNEVTVVIQNRSRDIDAIKEQIQNFVVAKAQMDRAIARLRIFEDFLNTVRDKYRHLFEVSTDIIKRYCSLLEARKYVGLYYENSLQELENFKKKSDDQEENYYNKIVGMRIKLTNLSNRYETSVTESKRWELILNEIMLESIEKLTETIMMKETCWRISKELCERKNIQISLNNCEKQCAFIKNLLYQYECVNQLKEHMVEENKRMSEKNVWSTLPSTSYHGSFNEN